VINLPFGTKFPNEIFIAQDGFNVDDGKNESQNFKFISWDKIARTNGLIIDNEHDFRK